MADAAVDLDAFGALVHDGDHGAAHQMFNEAFDVDGQPSPRANEFLESCEWGSKEVVVFRVSAEKVETLCCARIGGMGNSVRVCVGEVVTRADGTPLDGTCAIKSYTAQTRQFMKPWWYLSMAVVPGPTPKKGVRAEPWAPLGPPFTKEATEVVLSKSRPFTLPPGQWALVFSESRGNQIGCEGEAFGSGAEDRKPLRCHPSKPCKPCWPEM
jgi:hypothetical protein